MVAPTPTPARFLRKLRVTPDAGVSEASNASDMPEHHTATHPARATVYATRPLLLTASGHVDAGIAAEITKIANDSLGPEIDVLVLDLTAVTTLDDRAATALLNLADHLRAADLPTELRPPATPHPALTEAATQGRLRIQP
jgi:STAS domain-containing protein